jgi:hypothetical protein
VAKSPVVLHAEFWCGWPQHYGCAIIGSGDVWPQARERDKQYSGQEQDERGIECYRCP